MGPAIPHLPALAFQPLIDPAAWDVEHDLPISELAWGETSPLVALDPATDGLISRRRAEPLDRLPGPDASTRPMIIS